MTKIVTAPDPVLRSPTKTVHNLDKKTLDIITDMTKTLLAAKNPEGVGLAAPQVGLSLKIFLIRPKPKKPPQVFINPEIISLSKQTLNPESEDGVYEGCLSIPDHYAPVPRSKSVKIKYQTPELKTGTWHLVAKTEVFSGFAAHIIQHEMDHLNGILFIDHVVQNDLKLFKIKGRSWSEVTI